MSTWGFGSAPVHLARAARRADVGIGGHHEDHLVVLAQAARGGVAAEVDGVEPGRSVVGGGGSRPCRLLSGA